MKEYGAEVPDRCTIFMNFLSGIMIAYPEKKGEAMKKTLVIFALIMILIVQGSAAAQNGMSLPQIRTGIPDPAAVLGSVGSLYMENFSFYDVLYDAYLYPQPENAETFIAAYTQAAQNTGYAADPDTVEGYGVLRVYPNGSTGNPALLFYNYQGYTMLMLPVGMEIASVNEEPAEPSRLVEMGQEAIQRQDYQTAVRYLVRAAGSYIKAGGASDVPAEAAPTATETPVPGGPTTYIVEDGDNCWSIAVDKFGVNFELFMKVNNLTECNIHIGDEVIIPGADQEMPTMTPIPLDQYATGQIIEYVVEMNDSYNDIAQKFNTTLQSIQGLNNVNVYTGFPQYGQVLQIQVNLITPTPTIEPTGTPAPGTLEP